MTQAMTVAAQMAAPGMHFEGWTSQEGPPAIQGRADGEAPKAPLLDLVRRANVQRPDGIMIGCFDDTALEDVAALAPCPVLGIGQAAFHLCAMRHWRFSVVTTLAVSVPIIAENISRYGLDRWLGQVRASDVPVLALEDAPETAAERILEEAHAAVRADGIDAVVLGCAGMVNVTQHLRAHLHIPVIDPVEATARAMAWLAADAKAQPA